MENLLIQRLSNEQRVYAIEFNSIVAAKKPKNYNQIYKLAYRYFLRKCYIFDINGKVIGNTKHFENCIFPDYLAQCGQEYKRDVLDFA